MKKMHKETVLQCGGASAQGVTGEVSDPKLREEGRLPLREFSSYLNIFCGL